MEDVRCDFQSGKHILVDEMRVQMANSISAFLEQNSISSPELLLKAEAYKTMAELHVELEGYANTIDELIRTLKMEFETTMRYQNTAVKLIGHLSRSVLKLFKRDHSHISQVIRGCKLGEQIQQRLSPVADMSSEPELQLNLFSAFYSDSVVPAIEEAQYDTRDTRLLRAGNEFAQLIDSIFSLLVQNVTSTSRRMQDPGHAAGRLTSAYKGDLHKAPQSRGGV
ncbi:hypothetical protein CTheo_8439 [Ceratobasidium theobromae]|uniref:Uncharacterized protein n=1 Tax=Ceratobasidium theobromae TaxID=1582974 RepID=A0A5N5Q9N4_9AGAM|nr:hypothetical protein CTheo_8439 [Ceratobasidium theobromae]